LANNRVRKKKCHEIKIQRTKKTTHTTKQITKTHKTMGNFMQRLLSSWQQQPTKIVMVGLDAAGKTTVLYKLKLGEVSQKIFS